MEAGPIPRGRAVAVPAAIGPLPLEERLDKRSHGVVAFVSQATGYVEAIPLHRRVREIEPVLTKPLWRIEAARVGDPGQLDVQGLVQLGADVRAILREREVREADQAPVQAPPLAIRVFL